MILSQVDDCLLMMWTTDPLSVRKRTLRLANWGPNSRRQPLLGRIHSMLSMVSCKNLGYHFPWNQCPLKKTPNPMPPAASVNNSNASLSNQPWSRNGDTPLKCWRNSHHIDKSSFAPGNSRALWCGFFKPCDKPINLLVNARPGATARNTKLSEPTNDVLDFL